ncbi:MAG: glycosyl transferase family 1, partial [Candidatus Omnitrophica bacterium]|nr:glycosyl transferase family 1 [Candidatus Omnitrophota bacterium]
MPDLSGYEPVVGPSVIEELRQLAKRLARRSILMVNSTRTGGGVAEILNWMIPLLGELELDTRWEVIEGSGEFYTVTKKFHNALHGKAEAITQEMFDRFVEVGRRNAERMSLKADIVFIHDPQPIVLVERRKAQRSAKWLWRCHIDVSRPQKAVWDFLKPYILQFDASIYSSPAFTQQMATRQVLVAPSIDPLSHKNRDLAPEEIQAVLRKLEIPADLPIITQVSRFDDLKDPLGVIDAFRRVRKSIPCRLVLAGGPAGDDPEADEVLNRVREKANGNPGI